MNTALCLLFLQGADDPVLGYAQRRFDRRHRPPLRRQGGAGPGLFGTVPAQPPLVEGVVVERASRDRVRRFGPSCHSKKVVRFSHHLNETVPYPAPHRQYGFSIPKTLRTFFLYDRKLLGKLSQCAAISLSRFFRTSLQKHYGIPGVVVAIQTFGDYLRWHPHLHALVADGLFLESGYFFVMPKVDPRPLRELFRAHVLTSTALTQHIPEHLFQFVRYCGWYSNRMRGDRKRQRVRGEADSARQGADSRVIDIRS